MPEDQTPPPPSSIAPSIANTSVSSMTRNSNRSRYRGNRSTPSYTQTSKDDMDFKGADEKYGVVIGVPSELPHLKYGATYDDFVVTMRDKLSADLKHGHQLLPVFNKLRDLAKDYETVPKEDTIIKAEEGSALSVELKQLTMWKLKL